MIDRNKVKELAFLMIVQIEDRYYINIKEEQSGDYLFPLSKQETDALLRSWRNMIEDPVRESQNLAEAPSEPFETVSGSESKTTLSDGKNVTKGLETNAGEE